MANGIQLHAEGIGRALEECREVLQAMGGEKAAAAMARALNRALSSARTEAARIARAAYTAPAKKWSDSVKVRQANSSDLSGELVVQGKPGISLINFRTSPKTPAKASGKGKRRLGVRSQVKRGGGMKTYPKAFVMQKRQGGYGVFERLDGRIRMLLGPSPVQALERREDQERIMARAEETFSVRLRHEIDAIVGGLAPGGRR